jgi:hypothetical protein
VRSVLIYCSDYQCSHWTRLGADRWRDDVRLFDLEQPFTCTACRKKGADVRLDWQSVERQVKLKASDEILRALR